MRTFIAVPLDQTAHAALESVMQQARRAPGADAWRFVRPESVHLTLKFLGNVAEDMPARLAEALSQSVAGFAPFEASLEGAGAFPSPTRPQVLWIGIKEGAQALADLAAAVDRALAGLGFVPEARAFKPHLTLARAKDPRRARALAAWIAEHAGDRLGRFPVREVVLFQSQLHPSGAVYTPLASAPLAA